jgi:hypothetical protein
MVRFEVLTAASTMSHRPDDRGSKDLWNVGKRLPDYMALQPRRQPSCKYLHLSRLEIGNYIQSNLFQNIQFLWGVSVLLLKIIIPLCNVSSYHINLFKHTAEIYS